MSETTHKVRSRIVKRLNSLSQEKLLSLEEFLDQIEPADNSIKEVLSFAGSLKDIDKEVFVDLTDKLHLNRLLGNERIS
ncbi:MAG: hypothetical protein K9H64_12700 [Bacteroidales bacterium]|nr:hypothetical protein [Bacteroidales bacterium]MCF8456893.1 hypothetical protein [Bacteroidales bacterium]